MHADLLALRRAAIFTLHLPAVVTCLLFFPFPPHVSRQLPSEPHPSPTSSVPRPPWGLRALPCSDFPRSTSRPCPRPPLAPTGLSEKKKKKVKKSKLRRSRTEKERLKSIPSGGAGSPRGVLRRRGSEAPALRKAKVKTNVFREGGRSRAELRVK